MHGCSVSINWIGLDWISGSQKLRNNTLLVAVKLGIVSGTVVVVPIDHIHKSRMLVRGTASPTKATIIIFMSSKFKTVLPCGRS